MGPEKWKGELPPDEAAERERGAAEPGRNSRSGRREQEPGAGAPRRSIEDREDEGYDQPESSAQKQPPPGPGPEDLTRE